MRKKKKYKIKLTDQAIRLSIFKDILYKEAQY